ncbi:MAG: right-handed parallel beta-helix repeat-containing protein [Planctomycetota bacterium]|jgi:hypothetical protein
MKKQKNIQSLVLLISMLFCVSHTYSQTFYVATNGSDSNPGTKDKPLATLAGARDKVRTVLDGEGDITVYFRGGYYQFKETVVFGLKDSGSRQQTITYAAYAGEEPVFGSGVKISGWKKLETYPDALLSIAKGKVWAADLPETKGGKWRFLTLFDGEKMLPRAQSAGFRPTDVLDGEFWQGRDKSNEQCSVLNFPKGTLKNWSNLEDVEIKIFPAGYTMNMLALASVDEENLVARTTIPATYPMKAWPWGDDPSVWVENILEALDEPGEWVLNTQEGRLYFWPQGEKPSDNIVAPKLRELVRVEGSVDKMGPVDVPVQYLTFRGLTFTHGDRDVWTKDDAAIQHDWEICDKPTALLRFRSTEHCLVDECRFTNTGGTGVRFDLHSQYNKVQRSLFEYLGQAGILFCGYGPGSKDVSHHNEVINNRIHHCGEIYQHGHAIIFWCSGENLIAHNLIHDTPRKAVSVSGPRPFFFNKKYSYRRECSKQIRWHELPEQVTQGQAGNYRRGPYQGWDYTTSVFNHVRNNVVEYNEAYRVLGVGADGAAINMTGTGEGNIIRRNYVHDVINPGPDAIIRLDTAGRATQITENIIYNCPCNGIIWNDQNNNCENNIIVDVKRHAIYCRHLTQPGRIQRNIIYNSGKEAMFFDTLNEVKPYAGEFNLFYTAGNPEFSEAFIKKLQQDGTNKHSISADPMFIDLKNKDFRLKDESPMFKLGFKQIDMSKIGLRDDFPERFR